MPLERVAIIPTCQECRAGVAIRGRSACRRQKLFRASALSQRPCGVPAFAGRDFRRRGLDYAGVVGTAVLTIPSDEPGLSAQATAALPSVSGTGERPGAPARVPFTAWRGWTHDPQGLLGCRHEAVDPAAERDERPLQLALELLEFGQHSD